MDDKRVDFLKLSSRGLFLAGALGLILGGTGCSSMVPFTYELRSGHQLSEPEVKDLQFYSSHDILLRREVQSEDRQVTPGHKLRLISGRRVEEVVIAAHTPGVATRVSSRAISVSFIPGASMDFVLGSVRVSQSDDVFLRPFAASEGAFAPKKALTPALLGQTYAQPPGRHNPIVVAGDTPQQDISEGGNYYLAVEPSGQVSFAGVRWDAIGSTSQAHLLIDADKLEETEERRTVLPGVRLGN